MSENLLTSKLNADFDNENSEKNNIETNYSLISYYRNRAKRLAYQKNYDSKHKDRKKLADDKRYQKNKNEKLAVKQSLKEQLEKEVEKFFVEEGFLRKFPRINIDIFRDYVEYEFREQRAHTMNYGDTQKLEQINKLEEDSLNHCHGAPQTKKRIYYKRHKGKLQFHIIENICFIPTQDRFGVGRVRISDKPFKHEVSGKQLNQMYCTFFGLQDGDSLVFKNEYGEKCCINFDGSGLDIADINVFNQLQGARIETGLKGIDLIKNYAEKYSHGGYVRYYRGNKIFLKIGGD